MIMAGEGGEEPPQRRLTVQAIRDETHDAKSFFLVPERGEESLFRYTAGQFLSFRIPFEDRSIVRSYSLSSAPGADPDLRICVKRVDGGRGSNWFHDQLTVGDRVEATAPSGRFTLRESDGPVLLVAGGSGITPCVSLLKDALLSTDRRIILVYANRDADSVIYADELESLRRRGGGRVELRHHLDDAHGFLTPDAVASIAEDAPGADCYVCGPAPLMDMAEETLGQIMGEDAHIVTERFVSPDDDAVPPEPAPAGQPALIDEFRLTLDDEDHTVPYVAGQTLLEAGLAQGIDVPMSCTEGHCGTCMGLLKSGEVEMASTKALSKRNIERGYVLACQARPASPEALWLDYDE